MLAAALVLLVIGSFSSSHWTEAASVRRPKRIAFGEPMPSLDIYRIYYFVQLRYSWACTSDQTKHDELLFACLEDRHKCGGSLVHPEFVLTAAHCVMYWEVVVYEKGKQTEDWVRDTADLIYYSVVEAWERLTHAIISVFVQTKPRHTLYSDWSLLMGSTNWFKMTQKRHVMKVFPHRKYPKVLVVNNSSKWFDRIQNSYHDVALLRACEPFKIKPGEIELAPMLRTKDLLREHYESVVTRGTVCLYVGFGLQDNSAFEAFAAGYPRFSKYQMLHTWRSSVCNAACKYDAIARYGDDHTCNLCSYHHGHKLGTPQAGDSGSPVTCDGRFVSTLTKAGLVVAKNYTRTDSYPVHCIIDALSDARLEYYKTILPGGEPYHPLNGTRWKRLPLPPE